MPVISVRIPQIGEGLQEARLVAMLKQPGDKVKRDEPIYQMETDKAVMDVESPYEGTLVEWLAEADQILPIGGEVAKMEVEGDVKEDAPAHGTAKTEEKATAAAATTTAASGGARNVNIPPRTRAYAKEKGISSDDLENIPAASGKLMPSDIDAYLSGDKKEPSAAKPKSGEGYTETEVPQKQRLLSSRLVRGSQLVVPGTITLAMDWEPIENLRTRLKAGGGSFQPSAFTMFAYVVAQVLKDFPSFRSTLIGDEILRTYEHVSLGIAVSLPGDELVLAVVEDADTLEWEDFAKKSREKIELARGGKDQANEAVTISLTNMQSFGIRDAVPVVVPPSVATLFIGEVYNGLVPETEEMKMRRSCNLALTFDHRVINGVGAAQFINAVKEKCETIGSFIIL